MRGTAQSIMARLPDRYGETVLVHWVQVADQPTIRGGRIPALAWGRWRSGVSDPSEAQRRFERREPPDKERIGNQLAGELETEARQRKGGS
jgi:hypothetical protein